MKNPRPSKLLSLVLSAALCLALIPAASAAGSTTVVLKLGCNQMAVGTAVQPVDDQSAAVTPIAENNRTLVPVSRIVAAFGGKSTWEAKTNATTFTLNGKTVSHVIGSNTVTTPGGVKTMEVPSKAMNNRTYVPVRYVLEGLGLNVGYESKEQLVVVSTGSLSGKDLLSLPASQALLEAQALNVLPASNYTKGTQIAPARTRADMEPKYTDGAYIQDLAAATGFTLYKNRVTYDNNIYGYTCDYGLSDQEVLDQVEAYVDLLSAQPDLELVRPFSESDSGATYVAYFNYTGSKVRMKGDLKAWFWDNRTVHVEVCVSLPTRYSTSREILVSLDKNLRYADLGLRTREGADLLSTQQIFGDRAGDAYYLDKGSYYNSSDKALSTTSGKAALLIDGRSYTAQAKFETALKDHITLSGFERNTVIDLTFAIDYSVTGDVYGLDDLRYGPSESTWGPYICVNYDDYSSWSTPLAGPDRGAEKATVRILRWDKSGSGDTVVYFYILADDRGVMRTYEGLVAVPWTDPNARPAASGSGSVLDKKDCWYCGGWGTCPTCHGSGRLRKWVAGTVNDYVDQDCTDCYSPGRCRLCNGTGKQ